MASAPEMCVRHRHDLLTRSKSREKQVPLRPRRPTYMHNREWGAGLRERGDVTMCAHARARVCSCLTNDSSFHTFPGAHKRIVPRRHQGLHTHVPHMCVVQHVPVHACFKCTPVRQGGVGRAGGSKNDEHRQCARVCTPVAPICPHAKKNPGCPPVLFVSFANHQYSNRPACDESRHVSEPWYTARDSYDRMNRSLRGNRC